MLSIIFEDDFILVVNKPVDLLVHHSHYSRNIRETSLAELVRAHCGHKIHPVHRIDRKTSGIVLFAKDPETTKRLQAQFETGIVKKTYTALVRGYIEDKGLIESPIKNDGTGIYQEAATSYTKIEQLEYLKPVEPYASSRYSLVNLSPITGRTHQLRKHMNKISHPIIGDPKHGNRHHNHAFEDWFGHSHLFLHARSLEIQHPSTKKMLFSADYPDFWRPALEELGFNANLQNL